MFQASIWRDYAMTWQGKLARTGVDRAWCERVARMTYAGCLRLARVHVYLARRRRRGSAA